MNNLQKIMLAVAIGLSSVAVGSLAHAQQASAATTQDARSEGEIKKVDKGTGKLTIKHGELKNLHMPAMIMVFKVNDPAMLDKIAPGDKVRFVAEQLGGVLAVTTIEAAK